jgi:CBS-domain-containing membrane protein
LSLILEDALMLNASKVAQFMVRDVTEAKAWHPISYIRQLMLTHAFSYLPLRDEETWKVVPDYSIARYLRKGEPKLRNARLTNVTSEAVGSGDLKLLKAQVASPTTLIADIVADISEQPLLVVDQAHKDEIVGILTASDIL